MDRMGRRNTLYYMAAVGTVLVFIVAFVALSTCGEAGISEPTSKEQAVLDAYQQGYLDGYSKGYSEGFSSGRGSNVEQQSEVALAASRECALPAGAAGVAENTTESAEE